VKTENVLAVAVFTSQEGKKERARDKEHRKQQPPERPLNLTSAGHRMQGQA